MKNWGEIATAYKTGLAMTPDYGPPQRPATQMAGKRRVNFRGQAVGTVNGMDNKGGYS
ncbi:MAG: hypothetical protein NTX52_09515 [Planctomycetota bacterium]|nr:hypothetical protein [Planctomycetota bacterium]